MTTMEIKAELRHLHIAPRKVRLAAHLIKGMRAEDAERELAYRIKRASDPLRKLLRSAVANAGHNFHADTGSIFVKDIRVNAGPVAKRFRPRAFGRAAPIRRRTSHVVLILETAGMVVPVSKRERAPVVREATREDLRQDAGAPRHPPAGGGEKPDAGRAQKPKESKFIRRIFQRKAI